MTHAATDGLLQQDLEPGAFCEIYDGLSQSVAAMLMACI
jgi:hypothetical protein